MYYTVAANTPFNNSLLTYSWEGEIRVGSIVEVPLGKRKILGVVLNSKSSVDFDSSKIKEVIEIVPNLCLTEEMIKTYQWMSKYYHYPVGKLIIESMPKVLTRPRALKGVDGRKERELSSLSDLQMEIFHKISLKLGKGFSKSLIHGVTGSGKSQIYIHLIEKVLSEKKSALFLLPEINLTPQFIDEFSKLFTVKIYKYNSEISNSDKFELWRLLSEGHEPCLVIGVRSAIFLPLDNFGLIVIDEEHDSSFKQEDRCRYNARDLALKRASILNVPVVLGSATPSLETYGRFNTEENNYFPLRERYKGYNLPEINILDSRTEEYDQDLWPFDSKTIAIIKEAVKNDEQVLVFVNKLGFARFLQCSSCGHQFSCPNCETNLTFFKSKNSINCSICNYSDIVPKMCPSCSCLNIKQVGFGTEKLAEVVRSSIDTSVARFDREEIKNMRDLESRLSEFHEGKIKVLIGTQMLSKGHNFKNVNNVIVMGIDTQMNFPDFRAGERSYQLLTQISGRSGRFGKKGHVYIQTLSPENEIFQYIKDHDFDGFLKKELALRKEHFLPPKAKFISIDLTSKNQSALRSMCFSLLEKSNDIISAHYESVSILGPRPSMVEKRVNKFTWNITYSSENINELHNLVTSIEGLLKEEKGLEYKIDVDPQSSF